MNTEEIQKDINRFANLEKNKTEVENELKQNPQNIEASRLLTSIEDRIVFREVYENTHGPIHVKRQRKLKIGAASGIATALGAKIIAADILLMSAMAPILAPAAPAVAIAGAILLHKRKKVEDNSIAEANEEMKDAQTRFQQFKILTVSESVSFNEFVKMNRKELARFPLQPELEAFAKKKNLPILYLGKATPIIEMSKKEKKTIETIKLQFGHVIASEFKKSIEKLPQEARQHRFLNAFKKLTEREAIARKLQTVLAPFQTTKPETKESLESQATTLIQHFTELDEKQRKEFFKQTFLPKEHEKAVRDYAAEEQTDLLLFKQGSSREAKIEKEIEDAMQRVTSEELGRQFLSQQKALIMNSLSKNQNRQRITAERYSKIQLALSQQTELAKQKEMLSRAGAATELPAPTLITTTAQLKSLQRTTARLEGYIKKYGAATATQLITAIERVKPTPKISLLRQRTTTDLVREQVIAGLKKRKQKTQRATYFGQVNELLRQKNNAEQALENLKQLNARRKIKEEQRALKQQKRATQPTQTHTLTPQRRPSTVPPQQTPPKPQAPPTPT